MSIQEVRNNVVVYNLRAMNFKWEEKKQQWTLNNVLERYLQGKNEKVIFSPTTQKSYSFRPIDLRKDDYLKDQMTTSELRQFIDKEKMRGSEMLGMLEVELYNRDAIPVSVLILTIIGAVLASRKVRGGSGLHLAMGVLISVTYILFSRFSIVFATKGSFTPWLAAWTPNIFFGLLAIYLYRLSPK